MAGTRIYSWHKNGHAGPTRKGDAELHVSGKKGVLDFLLALSIGSVAFSVLLLSLTLTYLLHGLSAEMLAIWVCCGVAAPALLMIGGGLFLFTKGIPREAAQASEQRCEEIERRIDQIRHDLAEKTTTLARILEEDSSQRRST
jgi:hypothetical protein